MKSGQGKDGAKKPVVKFPGLVKKLQAEAAKKAPKGRPRWLGVSVWLRNGQEEALMMMLTD